MRIGIVGQHALVPAIARRLQATYRLRTVAGTVPDALDLEGLDVEADLPALARSCDLVLVCAPGPAQATRFLTGAGGLCDGLAARTVVVDQTPADPAYARVMAAAVQSLGAAYLDAPLHCELSTQLAQEAAVLCGGPAAAFASARPVLEAICPKVVRFGEAGSGQAARLVVATVAMCNRLVTYECAAMGARNGLSLEAMTLVLNRSSAANSASQRVLPALASGAQTSDQSLADVALDLTRASALAYEVGVPLLIGSLARSLLQAEANAFGPAAGLDNTYRMYRQATAAPATDASA